MMQCAQGDDAADCAAIQAAWASWGDATGWTSAIASGASICSFEGVNCNGGHRVRELAFYGYSLGAGPSGTLPAALGLLAQMQSLNIANCGLQGTIPPELGSLQFLNNIMMYSNALSGTLPSSLGSLSLLSQIDLAGNQLTGTIPSSLSNLLNLQNMCASSPHPTRRACASHHISE